MTSEHLTFEKVLASPHARAHKVVRMDRTKEGPANFSVERMAAGETLSRIRSSSGRRHRSPPRSAYNA